MIRIVLSVILLSVINIAAFAQQKQDRIKVSGTVISAETGKPLAQCNVYIDETGIGTITNNSGEFVLKAPGQFSSNSLVISYIGYESYRAKISELPKRDLEVSLELSQAILGEVVIGEVSGILSEALRRKDENYPTEGKSMTSFYREVVRKNRSYMEVSQGILNIAKTPYTTGSKDQLYIVKGSKSENYSPKDTLAFRVAGGPNVMLLLDIVKRPGLVLDPDIFDQYQYVLLGSQIMDNKSNYVIRFQPKEGNIVPLFAGTIYVEKESLAISGLKFGYDDRNMELAYRNLVKKQPATVKVKPVAINYEVQYREVDDKWYLDYVRNEVEMKIRWKKRLFNSTFRAVSEMVVTDKDNGQSLDLNRELITREWDLFSEKVISVTDPAFWQEYSIIEPEDDLKKAISKINRKNSKN